MRRKFKDKMQLHQVSYLGNKLALVINLNTIAYGYACSNMEITREVLKPLIVEVQGSLTGLGVNDLELASKIYGPFDTASINWLDVTKSITGRIKNILQVSLSSPSGVLNRWDLTAEYVYEAILDGYNNDIYISITQTWAICVDHIGCQLPEQGIRTAIMLAKDYILINGTDDEGKKLIERHSNYFDRGQAAKRLVTRGCVISLEGEQMEIKEGLDQVVAYIEELIANVGGVTVMSYIFRSLYQLENYRINQLDRYVFLHPFTGPPYQTRLVVPHGYILNLAAKYPYVVEKALDPAFVSDNLEQIIDIAADLLIIQGGQRSSVWEVPFLRLSAMIGFITHMAVFDISFGFVQSQIRRELNLVRALLSWPEIKMLPSYYGFSLLEYLQVADIIERMVASSHGPVELKRADVVHRSAGAKVSVEVTNRILKELSHDPSQVNLGFVRLHDQQKVNVYLKPLIEISPETYLMYDRNWSAPGFFEVMYGLIKRIVTGADRQIGIHLEKHVRHLLVQKGMKVHHGNFKNNKQVEGDCDALVEATDTIILIEVKKSPLTRKAQSGLDHHVITDLAETLIKAQEQLGKIEVRLRSYGFIDLEQSDGTIKRILWEGRKIEKIALSHQDFYSFQDQVFVDRFLSLLIDVTFTPKAELQLSAGVRNKFFNLNKSCQHITEHFLTIGLDDPRVGRPFIDTWFLSLPMLELLLDGVNSATAFLTNLQTTKHMTFGSGSFYYEYFIMKQARKAAS